MLKKILSLAVLSAISTLSFAQDTSIPKFNQDFKVSAVIDPGCFLEAENINFGVLQMPIQDQATQSNMKVKCSKGATLKIGLEYGASSSGGTMTARISAGSSNYNYAYKIQKNNVEISSNYYADVHCFRREVQGKVYSDVYFETQEALNLYGLSNLKLKTYYNNSEVGNVCDEGWGTLNMITLTGISGFGKLSGLTSGETIAYYVERPTDNSFWTSSNVHTFNGSGDEQVIPMKARIKRADNPTHRMTPDTYQSTLTVVLTY